MGCGIELPKPADIKLRIGKGKFVDLLAQSGQITQLRFIDGSLYAFHPRDLNYIQGTSPDKVFRSTWFLRLSSKRARITLWELGADTWLQTENVLGVDMEVDVWEKLRPQPI